MLGEILQKSIDSLLQLIVVFFSFTSRYVYLPLDSLYLLLITNRASNIVEDLETIKLISKCKLHLFVFFCTSCLTLLLRVVVPNITGSTGNLTEEKVSEFCFDLLFAFDEVCYDNI